MNLKEENKILKKKLQQLQKNYIREVQSHIFAIQKKRSLSDTASKSEKFMGEEVANIVCTRIAEYFGEENLLNFPDGVYEQIVSAELYFYHINRLENIDGFAVLASYHKSFDMLLEDFVIKPFRSYVQKNYKHILLDISVKNNLIEKHLYAVLVSGHRLSIGKLFQLLKNSTEKREQGEFMNCFEEFLQKQNYISENILKTEFIDLLQQLSDLGAFGEKRHRGFVSSEETKQIRMIMIGDLQNKNSLLYHLVQIMSIDF